MASETQKLRQAICSHEDAVTEWTRGDRMYEHVQAWRDAVVSEAMDMRDAAVARHLAAERARVAPVMDACRDVLAKIREMQQDAPDPNDLRRKHAREISYMALEIVVAYEALTAALRPARHGGDVSALERARDDVAQWDADGYDETDEARIPVDDLRALVRVADVPATVVAALIWVGSNPERPSLTEAECVEIDAWLAALRAATGEG